MNRLSVILFSVLVSGLLGGCQSAPREFPLLRERQPRTILVLPPINHSTDVGASYSMLTTALRPLAELGYYVVPMEIADRFMKENGLPGPEEMHQAPISKLHEIFGADAVLYVTIEKFGTKYIVIDAQTTVSARAVLVDTATGVEIWDGRVSTTVTGNGVGGHPIATLVGAAVSQIVDKMTDKAHFVAAQANVQLLAAPGKGLIPGHRHPEFGK